MGRDMCSFCGKSMDHMVARCQYSGFLKKGCVKKIEFFSMDSRTKLCEDCAKKCNKCGKYFCPEHINNHKCR